jgi:hypothetical protein
MWATHPEMAKEWEAKTPPGKLPETAHKEAKKSGAKNPAAVAAAAGRKKYGQEEMTKLSQKGKKDAKKGKK